MRQTRQKSMIVTHAQTPVREARGDTLALLQLLELGNEDIAAGRVTPAAEVFARLRAKRRIA
jgi:hypothetical protein